MEARLDIIRVAQKQSDGSGSAATVVPRMGGSSEAARLPENDGMTRVSAQVLLVWLWIRL